MAVIIIFGDNDIGVLQMRFMKKVHSACKDITKCPFHSENLGLSLVEKEFKIKCIKSEIYG
jgi:hypothetical protein